MPTDWSNARHIRDITTSPRTKPSSRVSNRYAPRDRVTKTPRTGARSDATRDNRPRTNSSRTNSSRTNSPRTTSDRRSPSNSKAIAAPRVPSTTIITPANTGVGAGAGVTPNLVPRLAAPRLASPRTVRGTWGTRGTGFGYRTQSSFGYRNSLFNGYWGYGGNNFGCYGYSNWGYGYGGLSYWNDPYYWNIGVCSPYSAFRLSYWNTCYQNSYWNNWSIRGALPSNYWWYPSSTYCPTYLYVPSSVVYEDEPVDDYGAGYDVGYGAVAAARSDDIPGGAEKEEAGSPEALAKGYIELGDFYFKSNRFDAAAEAYAKARNHVPNDASVHFVLADAVFANGDYHYAAFLIAEAVRLDPTIVTAEVDKRDFYGERKTFDNQMEALQKYCVDKPYDAWAQLVLGYNMRFSDRPTRAVAAFRRVLELDRDNPTARAFLADLVPALRTGSDGEKGEKSAPAEDAVTPGEAAKIK